MKSVLLELTRITQINTKSKYEIIFSTTLSPINRYKD